MLEVHPLHSLAEKLYEITFVNGNDSDPSNLKNIDDDWRWNLFEVIFHRIWSMVTTIMNNISLDNYLKWKGNLTWDERKNATILMLQKELEENIEHIPGLSINTVNTLSLLDPEQRKEFYLKIAPLVWVNPETFKTAFPHHQSKADTV